MILSNSTVITLPLIKNNYFQMKMMIIIQKPKTFINMYLDEETKYTSFLKELRNSLLLQGIQSETKKFSEDKLTLRIQSLANNFYMSIWRSLSSDEKFVLFDYAAMGL